MGPRADHPSSACSHQLWPFKSISQPHLVQWLCRAVRPLAHPSSPHTALLRARGSPVAPSCLCPQGRLRLFSPAPRPSPRCPSRNRLPPSATQSSQAAARGTQKPAACRGQAGRRQRSPGRGNTTKALGTKAGYILRLRRPTGLGRWLSLALGASLLRAGVEAHGTLRPLPSSANTGVCNLGQGAYPPWASMSSAISTDNIHLTGSK